MDCSNLIQTPLGIETNLNVLLCPNFIGSNLIQTPLGIETVPKPNPPVTVDKGSNLIQTPLGIETHPKGLDGVGTIVPTSSKPH